ncbi:hypothetical protein HMPREF3038_01888 [Akkermansia sp. KLE1797]|nr:hypothetical protein HMPREF3038_01888 [Akkermansia sp. KLE1797]KXU54613.1 hypothetical protein HMPREF3039_01084 [Akkermansia sp. KLE1798]KZA05958.1 hypothetical protein HMPREF1326_00220 [Akkermansia sp. KLE1605]
MRASGKLAGRPISKDASRLSGNTRRCLMQKHPRQTKIMPGIFGKANFYC